MGSCLSVVLLAFALLLCCWLLPWWCCGHLELSRAVKVSPCLPSRSTPCTTFSRSTTINRETGYSNVLMSPQQIYSMSPQATPASSASLPNCHTHPVSQVQNLILLSADTHNLQMSHSQSAQSSKSGAAVGRQVKRSKAEASSTK